MAFNVIPNIKRKIFESLMQDGMITSVENTKRYESNRPVQVISTQKIQNWTETAIHEVASMKKKGKSNEEIKAHIDSYVDDLGQQISEQYEFQKALYYIYADMAYKQIGQLAPTSA
jgi:DNA-binding transcriptional regulator YhcF (GntR family)